MCYRIISFVFLWAILASCNKNNDTTDPTTPVTIDSSAMLLTRVTSYYDDTTGIIFAQSDVQYNDKLQIDTVLASLPSIDIDLLYQMEYNNDGDLTYFWMYGDNYSTNQELYFYYGNNRRLDSMHMIPHSTMYNREDTLTNEFTYDNNSHIQQMRSFYHYSPSTTIPPFTGDSAFLVKYSRNASGNSMDSIHYNWTFKFNKEYISRHFFTYFGGEVALDKDAIDRSLLLVLSTQHELFSLIFTDSNQDLFLHQYFNPDIPMIASGTTAAASTYDPGFNYVNLPHQLTAVLNPDGSVRLLTTSMKRNGSTPEKKIYKFEYKTIAEIFKQ